MPIRNFYIICEIDGYKTKLKGGPRAKDGGFNLTIYQRSGSEKIMALSVRGLAYADGKLVLEIDMHDSTFPVSLNKERLLTKQ